MSPATDAQCAKHGTAAVCPCDRCGEFLCVKCRVKDEGASLCLSCFYRRLPNYQRLDIVQRLAMASWILPLVGFVVHTVGGTIVGNLGPLLPGVGLIVGVIALVRSIGLPKRDIVGPALIGMVLSLAALGAMVLVAYMRVRH